MARNPQVARTAQLRPVATPIDTYARPATPERSNLWQLASALGGLEASLGGFLKSRRAAAAKTDALRGEAAFYKGNKRGFAKATSQGLIPSWSSPSYVEGYKKAQGRVAGGALRQKFLIDYGAWSGKSGTDPEAFQGFFADFLKKNVKTEDPNVLAGLLPEVRRLESWGRGLFETDLDKNLQGAAANTLGAEVGQAIDQGDLEGRGQPAGTDYEAVWSTILGTRQQGIDTGMRASEIDARIIATITAKAIELRDPNLLSLLDQTLPGTDFKISDTPAGQKAKQGTLAQLEVLARRSEADAAKASKARDKRELGDATRSVIDGLLKDPSATLPDDLLDKGSLYDPDFKVKALGWQKTIAEGGPEEAAAILEVQQDVLKGGGQGAITRALDAGIIKKPSTLTSLVSFAKGMEKSGEKMLNGGTFKGVMKSIKERTRSDKFLDPFGASGLTDAGLTAQNDYQIALVEWGQANPDASRSEVLAAQSRLGNQILEGIDRSNLEQPSYTRSDTVRESVGRSGFRPNDPLGAPAKVSTPPAQPPTDQQLLARPPDQPTAQPVADLLLAEPRPTGAEEAGLVGVGDAQAYAAWVGSLSPEQSVKLQQSAQELGISQTEAQTKMWKWIKDQLRGKQPEVTNPAAPEAATPILQSVPARDDGESLGAYIDRLTSSGGEATVRIQQALEGAGFSVEQAANNAATRPTPEQTKLLSLIGKVEARGDYNLMYGQRKATKDLTGLTIKEVIGVQTARLKRGIKSSALGKYQFLRKTLRSLVRDLKLTGNEKFDKAMQDRLATQLLKRRGYDSWKAGKITTTQLANNLAKEWASLPVVTGKKKGRSYYAGDGLNKALVSVDVILKALA